jgi:glycine hydroxymethyltransferase
LVEADMEKIVGFIDTVITQHENKQKLASVKNEINEWMVAFPLFK